MIEFFPHGLITGYTFYSQLFDGEPEVDCGYVELADRPGLGIAPNWETIERWRADQNVAT